MKIAICDDNRNDIKYLRNLIEISKICPSDAEFYEFTSGEELLENYQNYNIVFLDMLMGGLNGNQTAERIRKQDSEVILSFYSDFEVAAHKILHSRPTRYLLKSSSEKTLSEEIDYVLREAMNKTKNMELKIQYYGTTAVLKLSDILYISINNKGSLVWITENKANEIWKPDEMPKELALKSAKSLTYYYFLLKYSGFIYASKSYIVNAENVVALTPDCSLVLKNGCRLGLARRTKKAFEEEYGKFWSIRYANGRKS